MSPRRGSEMRYSSLLTIKRSWSSDLDPATLYASPQAIAGEVARVLDDYAAGNGGSREGHVFNLGHGISQFADPAHAGALVEAVHRLSRQYHAA